MNKIISITGSDGSGKSTLSKYLIDNHKGAYIHATHRSTPEMGCAQHRDFIEHALELKKWGGAIVLDRNWICTLVYENIFQNDEWREYIDAYLRKNMDWFLEKTDMHVVCIPEKDFYFKRFDELKGERKELYENMFEIYDAYVCLWHGEKQNRIKSKIFNEIIERGGLKTFPGFHLYDYASEDGKDMEKFILRTGGGDPLHEKHRWRR